MNSAMIILQQITVMFIIIIIGALLYKLGIITKDGNKQLSNVVLQLICPTLIFMAYQTEYNSQLLSGLIKALILAFVGHVIMIALSFVFIRNKEGRETAIERFSIIYSNCAFMGIPLIQGIYGDEGVLYVTAYITLFNLLVWTHGVMIMKDDMSIKGLINAVKSPSVIAVILGFICYVTNLRLPEVPAAALRHISNVNTPLAMLVAGATIAQTNILKALKKPRVLYCCFLKLMIIPVILIPVYLLFSPIEKVFVTIAIATACPTATTGTLFAVSYDRNAAYSSEIFALSTILSAVTLPLIVIFSNFLI